MNFAFLHEENEVNFQAEKIYEILIAPDPEMELEKYYDVAPNRFLKAFAGISYLTMEFGDYINDSFIDSDVIEITDSLILELKKVITNDYSI